MAPGIAGNSTILTSGFVVEQRKIGNYFVDFYRGGETLVVTFEAGGPIDRQDSLRNPWCLDFLVKRGFSVLGIKPVEPNWYLGKNLGAWFGSAQFGRFLKQFSRVAFMGGSMGGFAAISFSRVAPGALVLAYNPQSTFRRDAVPWEVRYPLARKQDWSGPYGDAADGAALARRVYIFYDPFDSFDRRHVERFAHANVEHLKMPFLGHGAPVWLRSMKIFDQVTELALAEDLSSASFAKMIRARRDLPRYYTTASKRLAELGRQSAADRFRAAGQKLQPESPIPGVDMAPI